MKKHSKSKIINGFLKKMNEADEGKKMRSKIADSPQIREVLKSYKKSPNDIEEIFWRLMASGAGSILSFKKE